MEEHAETMSKRGEDAEKSYAEAEVRREERKNIYIVFQKGGPPAQLSWQAGRGGGRRRAVRARDEGIHASKRACESVAS